VSTGTHGVTTGAMDRDLPLRRLINQVEYKPSDTLKTVSKAAQRYQQKEGGEKAVMP